MSSDLKLSFAQCHPHWQAVAGDGAVFHKQHLPAFVQDSADVHFSHDCAPLCLLLAKKYMGESGYLGEGSSLCLKPSLC